MYKSKQNTIRHELFNSIYFFLQNVGTGKTRLIVSIILQMLFGKEMKQKLRILVLASSNAAVDIIAKRLLHIREKMETSGKNGKCDMTTLFETIHLFTHCTRCRGEEEHDVHGAVRCCE